MLMYCLLIIIPLLIQHIKIRGMGGISYKERNKNATKCFFFILFLMLALRKHCVGCDLGNYLSIFRRISMTPISNITLFKDEMGYVCLNKLISKISTNPQFFIFIMSVIILGLLLPTYMRLCEDTGLMIVLFCTMSTFVMMFSGIRQMIAIGIGFVAYYFVREKKIIFFLVTVIFAMGFHTSAFMLLLMYPVYYLKIDKKRLLYVIPLIVIVFLFNHEIFGILSTYIETYTRFDAEIEETGAYMMIILLTMLSVFSYIIPNENEMDIETKGLRNFLILSLILQMFAPIHSLAMRMNYYYMIFIPLLIPRIIKYRRKKWSSIAIGLRHVMVVFFAIYFLISLKINKPLEVVPYYFFWEII